jgi:hypothetical protein
MDQNLKYVANFIMSRQMIYGLKGNSGIFVCTLGLNWGISLDLPTSFQFITLSSQFRTEEVT